MKVRTTIMVEEESMKKIKTCSARLGVSVSSFMTQCSMQQCLAFDMVMDRLLNMNVKELAEYKKMIEMIGGAEFGREEN